MKILYVGLKYNYGKPEQGHSFEHYNFYDALCKMDRAGHSVVYFPFDEIMIQTGQKEMNAQLLKAVRAEKPDMCFFVLFTEEFYPETIREITEKLNVPTFNWFADDHWRFDGFSSHWAPMFGWVGTTDSQAPAKYKAMGYEHAIKTQWACNHFLYVPTPGAKKYDVSFVGIPHGNRKQVAGKMRRAGIALECFGRGWPNGRVSQEDMIHIFGQSKINLNLTKASVTVLTPRGLGHILVKRTGTFHLGKWIVPTIGLLSPRDIMGNIRESVAKQREQIKGRNFEVPGCAGFLLTGNADNLQDYYIDGKEIVIFEDTNDMIDKIKYYVAHDREREAIAQAGYERTIREHTYEQRFREIFKIMNVYDR